MISFGRRLGPRLRPSMGTRAARAGVAAFFSLLGGCSSDQDSNWAQMWQAVSSIASPGQSVAREEVAAIPYASMGVRVGGSNEFILILVESTQATRLWTSGTRIVLVTASGRIVQTVGLERNLETSQFSAEDWLVRDGGTNRTNFEARRSIDLPDMEAYAVALNCTVALRGNEVIEILGTDIPTRLVEETCHAPELDWSFVNQFWLGQTSGFVWQSVQHVHPQSGQIETRVFRPPA